MSRFSFPRQNEAIPNQDNSPLFERMGSDEFAELQQCRQIIETLQERIQDLERINVDLEYRLEDQAKQCMSAEKECISIKREWKGKCDELEFKIKTWEKEYSSQQLKSDRLREHLSRTERELYGILQRKYEFMRGGSKNFGATPLTGISESGSSTSSLGSEEYQNPQLIPSPETRQRRVLSSLSDFLGF